MKEEYDLKSMKQRPKREADPEALKMSVHLRLDAIILKLLIFFYFFVRCCSGLLEGNTVMILFIAFVLIFIPLIVHVIQPSTSCTQRQPPKMGTA